jgi:hypothetical protein
MSAQGAELLKLLQSTTTPQVRPGNAAPRKGLGALDFASLLQSAQSGQIASGREVTLSKNSGVNLSADQLHRLSAAADRAEAMGASRALVLMDGQALTLDVSSREVTGQIDPQSGGLLNGIDAVLGVPPVAGHDASPGGLAAAPGALPLPLPGSAGANATLLRALSASSN